MKYIGMMLIAVILTLSLAGSAFSEESKGCNCSPCKCGECKC